VGATGLYRFSPIAANHTIEVSFAAPLPITGARGLGLLGAELAATALLALRFRPRSPVTPPSAD
jgi:hypothetical protein